MAEDVPEGFVRCDDGKLYPKRIVEGSFVMVHAGGVGEAAQERAKRIEAVLLLELKKMQDEGITDPEQVRHRMALARDKYFEDEAKAHAAYLENEARKAEANK